MSTDFLLILNDFKIIFLAIVIEALPFLLIGSIIGSLIHLYSSEKLIKRFLAKSNFIQVLTAVFLGMLFPMCECAIIPIAKNLIKKGIPIKIAIIFMLSSPIINPISIAATYFAFPNYPELVILRISCGLMVALLMGYLVSKYKQIDVLRDEHNSNQDKQHNNEHHCDCNQHCHCQQNPSSFSKFMAIISHTKEEFFGVGKYLIIGASIAAIIQVTLPTDIIIILKQTDILGIIFLQFLGYLFSICSYADAFVASGLLNVFAFFPVLGFLIVSPLIDLKNTIVLYGCFKEKFSNMLVVRIFLISFVLVFFLSLVFRGIS